MILKRLVSLQLILLGGLGSVFFLPKDIRIQPSMVNLQLPAMVGEWQGHDEAVTAGERDMLGPDTQFARKLFARGTDEIYVSVVLSGPDMNTSIHRPERCLPAQGWTIASSETTAIPLANGELKATRLHNIKSVPVQNGQTFTFRSLNYYWFIGHEDVTPSHYERTWIDIRDRVLKGQNQQWAYVTVTATVTKDFKVFGHDEAETDKMLRDFMRELVPDLQRTGTNQTADNR